MEIIKDDLSGKEIARFLDEHIEEMQTVSPPESKHALDMGALKKPNVTFWTVWTESQLVGCGALQELAPDHGEIKSMRTSRSHRGKGIGSELLRYIILEATRRGYSRISLETGSMAHFRPARDLYHKFGFTVTEPFSNYRKDRNSVYYSLALDDALTNQSSRPL